MLLWGIRVLIFDDDEALVREAAAVLQREGGAAIHVSGSHQALATIIGVTPDVMLVGVDRPALDAGRLMRLVRTLSPEKGGRIPAVSVSALPPMSEGWRGQCEMAHFQAHLMRPLEADAFVATAAELAGEWVERRHSQRERRQWPEDVREDRRREVRARRPPEFRAVLQSLRRGGRG